MQKRFLRYICCSFLFLCLLAGGCKEKEQETESPVQEAWTVYKTQNVAAYTLDEDGNLYAFEWVNSESELAFFLKKYDMKGNELFSKKMEEHLGSNVSTMTVDENLLYFAPERYVENKMCPVLHSYNLETEELKELKEFPYYEKVNRILVGEERIYLLGTKEKNVGMRSDTYTYTGEKVMCYIPAEDKVFDLGIEKPIDICLDEKGYLFLYAHTEEGFCFFLYDAIRDAIKTLAKTDEYKMCNMTLVNGAEEVIYQSSGRGLVVSSLSDLDVECELYPDGCFWDNNLCCVNGRVACITFDGSIVQFNLKDVKKENQVLRYISTGFGTDEPYGCGYEMQRTKLEEDKFALKIMALDKDFDVCLVDTAYSFSHNLKENGVFYPLNDVPGVQAYLDACFPYVREAATDEDGNIWMLPIAVDMPGLVVNEKTVNEMLDLITDNMTYEDYFFAHSALPEDERAKASTPWGALLDEFFRQYFAKNITVDTVQFREILRLYANCLEIMEGSETADSTERLYQHVIYGSDYRAYYITQMGENARVYEVPKVSPGSKNVGTCLFLAVNPYSNNLDATLNYISSWIAYTMKREDTPLFFKDRVVGDSVYETSLYELYENGEIGFTLDEEICAGYEEVLRDISKLEAYIKETERKLKIYLNE